MRNKNLELSLFSLRFGVFIVMIMWTIDKFVHPGHAARVFKTFYMIESLSVNASYAIGAIQLVIVVGFLLGIYKKFTYGSLLILHGISTASTWQMYIDPWAPRNLLFFAAFPMLSALFTLYLLRDYDNFLAFNGGSK